METTTKTTTITVEAIVNAPVKKVWDYWTDPKHIVKWNNASDDWHTPRASNDLEVGGKFSYTMAAKDGSFEFEFGGVYDEVMKHELIGFTMGDGRKVRVVFVAEGNMTKVKEIFEPEQVNSLEMQRGGWQAILDNFKRHVERPVK